MKNGVMHNMYDIEGFLECLCEEITKEGTQSACAKKINITPAYLSDILSGKRLPGKKILTAMGFKSILSYYKPTEKI
jgi:hypothetical protein